MPELAPSTQPCNLGLTRSPTVPPLLFKLTHKPPTPEIWPLNIHTPCILLKSQGLCLACVQPPKPSFLFHGIVELLHVPQSLCPQQEISLQRRMHSAKDVYVQFCLPHQLGRGWGLSEVLCIAPLERGREGAISGKSEEEGNSGQGGGYGVRWGGEGRAPQGPPCDSKGNCVKDAGLSQL
jgi:hypothetical protein